MPPYSHTLDPLRHIIREMIAISPEELNMFLDGCYVKIFSRKELVSAAEVVPQEIYFINQGLLRVIVTDRAGTEHTVHFALENQFIADYSSFIRKQAAIYSLQAVEETEVVVLPRNTIEWGYAHLQQGNKMGRLIAEYYFIYQDHRLKDLYARSPKERYDAIAHIFPNLHNRVPQHMIASYLGITPVHLSRLKKQAQKKS